jgi:hypothetical protein
MLAHIGHNQPPESRTLAYEPPDSLHILACARIAVKRIRNVLWGKQKWFEQFATNNEPGFKDCCRDLNAHDIEAWYSCPADAAKGRPDIYKIYCNTCGRCHVKFCVGGDHPLSKKFDRQERPDLYDLRPFWDVR